MPNRISKNVDRRIAIDINKHLAELKYLVIEYIKQLADDCEDEFIELVQTLISKKQLTKKQLQEYASAPNTPHLEDYLPVNAFNKLFRIHYQKADFVDNLRFHKLKIASQLKDLIFKIDPQVVSFNKNFENLILFLIKPEIHEILAKPRYLWTNETQGGRLMRKMQPGVSAIKLQSFDLLLPESAAEAEIMFLNKVKYRCKFFLAYLNHKVDIGFGYIHAKKEAMQNLQKLCSAGELQPVLDFIKSKHFKNTVLAHYHYSLFFTATDKATHSSDFYAGLTADMQKCNERSVIFKNNNIITPRLAS